MKNRKFLLASLSSIAALGLMAQRPASATPVATIDGAYDQDYCDTPELIFHNTRAYDITSVVLTHAATAPAMAYRPITPSASIALMIARACLIPIVEPGLAF